MNRSKKPSRNSSSQHSDCQISPSLSVEIKQKQPKIQRSRHIYQPQDNSKAISEVSCSSTNQPRLSYRQKASFIDLQRPNLYKMLQADEDEDVRNALVGDVAASCSVNSDDHHQKKSIQWRFIDQFAHALPIQNVDILPDIPDFQQETKKQPKSEKMALEEIVEITQDIASLGHDQENENKVQNQMTQPEKPPKRRMILNKERIEPKEWKANNRIRIIQRKSLPKRAYQFYPFAQNESQNYLKNPPRITRILPLRFWEGEKIVYQKGEATGVQRWNRVEEYDIKNE